MECKLTLITSFALMNFELIDTLWNVNQGNLPCGKSPLWINRYIMECKCQTAIYLLAGKPELIDTLWNVNCCS